VSTPELTSDLSRLSAPFMGKFLSQQATALS